MKKMLLLLCTATILLLSCGKNDPIDLPKPPPVHEQKEEQGGGTNLGSSPQKPQDAPKPDTIPSVPRPNDYLMTVRAQVKWKDGVNYYNDLDFDSFHRLKKADAITAEKLGRLANFSASDVEGTLYTYTAEDLAKTIIENVKYGQGFLTFDLRYNNGSAKKNLSLPFEHIRYYQAQVKVDSVFVSQHYMRGIYENPAVFNGKLLSYDAEKYIVFVKDDGKSKDDNQNSFTALVSVLDKASNNDQPLVEFHQTFTGFKQLSALKDELEVYIGTDLHDYVKRRVNGMSVGDVKNKFDTSIDTWICNVDFKLKDRDDLRWEKNMSGKNRLNGISTSNSRDIYLDYVRFELLTATLTRSNDDKLFLNLSFRLVGANDVVLADEHIDLKLPSIHISSR